jgi:hypothetical protein
MRKLILATCIVVLTSFCTKETSVATCGADHDWTYLSTIGLPNFQGNCYLVTNEQIRWAQLNDYLPNTSTAPDNKQCPTKAQIQAYLGDASGYSQSDEWNALGSSNCPAIGFFYGNL